MYTFMEVEVNIWLAMGSFYEPTEIKIYTIFLLALEARSIDPAITHNMGWVA